jgi:anti-sigma B factor antagonist
LLRLISDLNPSGRVAQGMASQDLIIERYIGDRGECVLLFRGPLTVETTSQFQGAVRDEQCKNLILDLVNVPYIDSVGLGALIGAHVSLQKAGRCLVLTGISPKVEQLLKITRVDGFLMTFPTTWEAIETLARTAQA